MSPVQIINYDTGTARVCAPAAVWSRAVTSQPAGLRDHNDGTLSLTVPLAEADAIYNALTQEASRG